MRVDSSPSMTSLTVRMAKASTCRMAAIVYSTAASISTPRWPRSRQRRKRLGSGS